MNCQIVLWTRARKERLERCRYRADRYCCADAHVSGRHSDMRSIYFAMSWRDANILVGKRYSSLQGVSPFCRRRGRGDLMSLCMLVIRDDLHVIYLLWLNQNQLCFKIIIPRPLYRWILDQSFSFLCFSFSFQLLVNFEITVLIVVTVLDLISAHATSGP